MKHSVFFSWQSDLPNSDNRNFIENCLEKAIKNLEKDVTYKLELNLDRDTINKQGSPDMADSIFEKISKSSFFVADVSIINHNSRKYKKTPNPNVLIELGYAINHLGWDRVVCLFNNDYGNLSDLPFDLRNRRIISYSLKLDKESERKKIVKLFTHIFKKHYTHTMFSNELMDYYNSDIYLSLYKILSDFSKSLYGYIVQKNSIENINSVLNLSYNEIRNMLEDKEILGFSLFKSYESYVNEICSQLEKIVHIKYFNDEYYIPIVRLINSLRTFNKEMNRRNNLEKFDTIKSLQDFYSVIGNNEITTPNEKRLVLLKKIDKEKGIVVDFGDFIRKDHIKNLLNSFKLKEFSLNFYSGFYF